MSTSSSGKKRRSKNRSERRRKRRSRRDNERQQKSELRQWGEALIFAAIVVLIVRTLFFDLFQIPTPSMEKNLMVGDYLFVSKVHYGTRLPMTLGVPFTQIHLGGIEFPYARIPGFTDVERGDNIVFNYPPPTDPIDRKIHYVKRVVGLPGETFEIRDKMIYNDGEPYPLKEGMQQLYFVEREDERYQFSPAQLQEIGVSNVTQTENPNVVRVQATAEGIEELEAWPWVTDVRPHVVEASSGYSASMYPSGKGFTPDNYGPVEIPAEGQTVTLTDENWAYLETVIRRFEGRTARRIGDDRFEIDGVETNEYTMRQDYYFTVGDNRDDSEDSRFWGFVPRDHVVGKALFTYFSWDGDANRPRFNRILRPIR